MDDQLLDFTRARWNRMLMNGFWCLLVLMVILEGLFLIFITPLAPDVFLRRYMLLPTSLHLSVLVLTELCLRFLEERLRDYSLLAASSLLTFIIVDINIEIGYIIPALFLPVLVSIFYFSSRKLIAAAILSLTTLYSLYFFNRSLDISVVGILSLTAMLGAFCLIAWGVISRGKEMRSYYIHAAKSNQELLVKNILMDKLAKTDALTELYNHITFHEYLDKLIEHHDATSMPLQLALIDIDNFKSVNDQFGHRAGDSVLKQVADLVRSQAGMNDFVARYGGEELALIFTDKSADKSLQLLETIRHNIEAASYEELGSRKITVSIGFADYLGEGKEQFFVRTDQALYAAKSQGKNRIVTAAAEPDPGSKSRFAWQ
ncbi:diguanylate cyclase [Paenibacillus albicereus]|uniref:Diguanylate cyclase n=1 Tax=Paenibacillus albicereus TaxID=2726185 RepID=A0A6H2H0J8_9BACL|nr:GGDEF domain-containing protein [Paenibacillus albicereus]QJC53213.1 diguanylate cyclase [Paenibacillus albicereus]